MVQGLPLTPVQEGILYETLRSRGRGVYVVQIVLQALEPLRADDLDRAFRRVVARHEALRMAFTRTETGAARQFPGDAGAARPTFLDMSGLRPDARDERLNDVLRNARLDDFDLARPPLLRMHVVKTGASSFTLALTYHHLILDGRAHGLLIQELLRRYDGLRETDADEAAPSGQFGDYLRWRKRPDDAAAQAFWRGALRGFRAPNPLPGGSPPRAPGPALGTRGRVAIEIAPATTASLAALADTHRVTLGVLVRCAWAIMLGRYTGDTDIVFGTTRECRRATVPGADATLGLFINTVPVRLEVDRAADFLDWLRAHGAATVALRPYEHTGLASIKSWSELAPGEPLFETVVIVERDDPSWPLRALGPRWNGWTMTVTQEAHYPLMLLGYGGRRLSLVLSYDHRRIDEAMARRMAGFLEALLACVAENPRRRLGEIAAEATARIEPPTLGPIHATVVQATFPELFERQALRTPGRVAVACGHVTLTYAALDERAGRLARVLRTKGVGPNVPVAVFLDRSVDLVVGILGVLKAGGAYIPIESSYPEARVRSMVMDSGASIVVTRTDLGGAIEGLTGTRVDLDALGESGTSEGETSRPIAGDDLAYVIFTSGSTGRPKGIAVEHRSLANLLDHATNALFEPADLAVVGVTVSIAFDGSISQIFTPLVVGGRVVIVENLFALPHCPDYDAITYLGAVPSLLDALLRDHPLPASLRVLAVAASQASGGFLDRLRGRWRPGLRLLNLYGPTEATVYCTTADLTPLIDARGSGTDSSGARVIGRPIRNVEAYVLDAHLEPVPLGVAGELCIGGLALARGYVSQDDATAGRFVAKAVNGGNPRRLYRTGDLARLREDGSLEFLGRMDYQVKLRGYRIELEEIEGALERHALVAKSAVAPFEDGAGNAALVAFIVPALPGTEPSSTELRRFLGEHLPRFMIPKTFQCLEALPTNATGKIDRRALPAPTPTELAPGQAAPRETNGLEQRVLEVWRTILARDTVGLDDDFFELGGDSIDAMRIVIALEQNLGKAMDLNDFFADPSPRGCVMLIGDRPGGAE